MLVKGFLCLLGSIVLLHSGGNKESRSARAGIDASVFDYVHLDFGIYHFNYRFSDAILHRDGLAWQDPDNIIRVEEKNNHTLWTGSITVNLDILK